MSLPLWGELEKAQDDSRTIEEYITDIIAEHNEDTEAHLGENESLKSHKSEEVIDHPEGSVLADKQTMTEIAVSTIFESLSGWSITGEVSNDDIPGCTLYIEDGAVEESAIDSAPQVPLNFRNSAYDLLFQTLARFDLSSNSYNATLGYFQIGTTTPEGFGFLFESGVIYAYAKQGANIYKSSSIGIDESEDHVYRVFLDAFNQNIKWYIDGSLVAEHAVVGSGWEDDQGPSMWLENISGNDGNLFIGELYFSRKI